MRGWLAVSVLGALALGGCGGTASTAKSDAKPNGPAVIVAATEDANTARFEGTLKVAGKDISNNEVMKGVTNFRRRAGTATVSEQVSTPQTTTPESMRFDGPMSIELRWIGTKGYMHFPVPVDVQQHESSSVKSWIETDSDADKCHSTMADAAFGSTAFIGAPGDMLAALRADGVTLSDVGHETVRGTDTTHWRAARPRSATTTTVANGNCSAEISPIDSTFDVWTDNQKRVRRVQTTASIPSPMLPTSPKSTPGTITIHLTSNVEFFDFGVAVNVSAPPADQIVKSSEADIDGSSGSSDPSSTGPAASAYTTLTEGVFLGKPWTVKSAKAVDEDGACYRVEGLPVSFVDKLFPSTNGSKVNCIPSVLSGEQPVVLASGAQNGQRIVIAVTSGNDSNAQLTFADKHTEDVRIDPHTHVLVWSGPDIPPAVKLAIGDQSCALDPSAIVLPAKPSAASLEQILTSGNLPCIGLDSPAATGVTNSATP